MIKFLTLLTFALVAVPTAAHAISCADFVAAYQQAASEQPGLVLPLFADGWDWQSGVPYGYSTADGLIGATAMCDGDGNLQSMDVSMEFDPSGRVHTTVAFSATTSAIGFIFQPETGVSDMVPTDVADNGDGSAGGDSNFQLDAENRGKVSVLLTEGGGGSMEFWLNP